MPFKKKSENPLTKLQKLAADFQKTLNKLNEAIKKTEEALPKAKEAKVEVNVDGVNVNAATLEKLLTDLKETKKNIFYTNKKNS